MQDEDSFLSTPPSHTADETLRMLEEASCSSSSGSEVEASDEGEMDEDEEEEEDEEEDGVCGCGCGCVSNGCFGFILLFLFRPQQST